MSGQFASPTRAGAMGLTGLSVTGTGLSANGVQVVREQTQQAEALAAAILAAIERARSKGLTSFAAFDGVLAPPEGMDLWQMAEVFGRVLGMVDPGDGERALSLSEWSEAAMSLQRDAASRQSRLAPGQGGGIQYADGRWYINGQAFTLAESFLALRMANYSTMDRFLVDQMNRTNLNTMTARKMVGLLSDLNASYANRGGSSGTFAVSTDLLPLLTQHGLTLDELARWGERTAGGGQFASVLASSADALSASSFAALITEAKSIFELINAENQVSQVRLDSVVNARDNVINGLNVFMKGHAAQQAALGAMVGGTLGR